MYRRETKEKAAYAGNRTRRTDSVKQHEMAALREMEQMVLAAENSEGTAGLEKAVAHLESFLQQVRKTRILDEKQRAMEAFRGKFEDGYTWRNGFLRNVARFGSRRALADLESGRVWNYTQLNAEANRFAHGLLRAGLRKGDVVMVQLHNCPEFVFAYLACHKTGMVFCPVNFRLSAKEIADCMDNSHPSRSRPGADQNRFCAPDSADYRGNSAAQLHRFCGRLSHRRPGALLGTLHLR